MHSAAASMAYAISYTGVEGLTLTMLQVKTKQQRFRSRCYYNYQTSYAYGPVTVAFAETEFDGAGTAANTDQEVTSYKVSYTVSDEFL